MKLIKYDNCYYNCDTLQAIKLDTTRIILTWTHDQEVKYTEHSFGSKSVADEIMIVLINFLTNSDPADRIFDLSESQEFDHLPN